MSEVCGKWEPVAVGRFALTDQIIEMEPPATGALVVTRYQWQPDANGEMIMQGEIVGPPAPPGFVDIETFNEAISVQGQIVAALELQVRRLASELAAIRDEMKQKGGAA